MNPTELVTNLTGGIRNPNYFNGRVLTAQDLNDQQIADWKRHHQIGKALGEGIVFGLEVEATQQPAVVRVSRGLAVNRNGEMLALSVDTLDIPLITPPVSSTSSAPEGLFARCDELSPQSAPTSAGYYLLTARPVSDFSTEKAPMVGLEPPGIATGCGNRYLDEGIRFGLHALDDTTAGVQTPSTLDKAVDVVRKRNQLAYRCFGVAWLEKFGKDPFALSKGRSAYATYGLIDGLRQTSGENAPGQLSDCDLPLALIYWTGSGIGFVDMWSVRRRLVQPLVSAVWPMHVGQRRLAEAEAMFLQFQAQLEEIRGSGSATAVKAAEWFRYLPAAGYLPLGGSDFISGTFFSGLKLDRWNANPALLRLLVQQSFLMAPIDLGAKTRPRILLYTPAEKNPDFLLFLRADASEPASVEVVPPPPVQSGGTGTKPETKPNTGDIEVFLQQEGKDPISWDKLDVDVWAVLEKRVDRPHVNKYSAKPVEGRSWGGYRKSLQTEGARKFVFAELPPGVYLVKASVRGFSPASQRVELQAGETERIGITLVRERDKSNRGTEKIPDWGRADILEEWYGKMWLLKEMLRWPWPPEEWIERPPFPDPIPKQIRGWLQDLVGGLQKEYPDAPIDPGDIKIYVAPGHNPGLITEEPYAYAVFGEGGSFAPLILTASNRTFGYDVPLSKGEMAGFDPFVLAKLDAAGLGTLDLLAASWSGLVANALGVSAEAANSLVDEAREKVDTLTGDTLLGHSGVTEGINSALKNLNIKNDVDLANQNPQALYTALTTAAGGVGNSVSLAFVHRLVDEARSSLPKDAWSLDASGLGLYEDEVKALKANGIGSQGEFKATGDAKLGGILVNLDSGGIAGLKGRIDVDKSAKELRAADIGKTPVTAMDGMPRGMVGDLFALNLTTTGQLANAKAAAVAVVFNGDVARAQALIDKAVAFNGAAIGVP